MTIQFTNSNNSTYNLQAQYRGGLFTKADVQTWVKQQWATMVRRELEQNLLMRQYVMMVQFPNGRVGDTITLPTLNRLGVNIKQPGVPVNLQATNTGVWQIKIDQYKETSFMIEDLVDLFLDPSGLLMQNMTKEAAYAISRDLDAFLLGLRAYTQNYANGAQVVYSSSDGLNTTTSVSEPFTIDAFLRAKLILDNNDVPQQDRVLLVSPTQYMQLLALDKVQSMFFRTSAPLESGVVGTLLGVPVYMTSMIGANVAATSSSGFQNGFTQTGQPIYVNTPGVKTGSTDTNAIYFPTQPYDTTDPNSGLNTGLPTSWANTSLTGAAAQVHTAVLMHREAYALAMLQEPKVEISREALYLSDAVITSTLYGAKYYRPKNAVLIHTNAEIPTT